MEMKTYRKRASEAVTAIQFDLDMDELHYRKWGGSQLAHGGDYLVNNGGEVYTVERRSFESTYNRVSPGRYVKTACVWAYQAEQPGSVATKEGSTEYAAGDYVVSNNVDLTDLYAVKSDDFERMYELVQ